MICQISLLLVGCGNMGRALLAGWLNKGLVPANVMVVDPGLNELVVDGHCIHHVSSPDQLPESFIPDFILIAVKPQVLSAVLPAYQNYAKQNCTFISIAAGSTIPTLQNLLGAESNIIRVMPNTPALIGKGCSVGYAPKNIDSESRKICSELFKAVGTMFWVQTENAMHAVTALSGSGPAYIFLLIETLTKAATEQGLPESLALPLAKTTVEGSAALAIEYSEPVSQLRKNVTSPGGTTEAALEKLTNNDALQQLISSAIHAAVNRSKSLAN